MELRDIEIGGCYHFNCCGDDYIVKIKGKEDKDFRDRDYFYDSISIRVGIPRANINDGGTNFKNMKSLRKTTFLETLHLEECLFNNSWVEPPTHDLWFKDIKPGDEVTCTANPKVCPNRNRKYKLTGDGV